MFGRSHEVEVTARVAPGGVLVARVRHRRAGGVWLAQIRSRADVPSASDSCDVRRAPTDWFAEPVPATAVAVTGPSHAVDLRIPLPLDTPPSEEHGGIRTIRPELRLVCEGEPVATHVLGIDRLAVHDALVDATGQAGWRLRTVEVCGIDAARERTTSVRVRWEARVDVDDGLLDHLADGFERPGLRIALSPTSPSTAGAAVTLTAHDAQGERAIATVETTVDAADDGGWCDAVVDRLVTEIGRRTIRPPARPDPPGRGRASLSSLADVADAVLAIPEIP